MGPTDLPLRTNVSLSPVLSHSKLPTFQAVDIVANCPLGKIYGKCNKITNLISELNFYRLKPCLMDKRGHPNRPHIHFSKGHLRLEE